jgi:P2 family phage contractile tail tube protein
MQIPNHVTNYSVFKDGKHLIGLADVTLPDLKNLEDPLKGSGIFGEIAMPVQAHFQGYTCRMKWLTVYDDAVFATIQDGAQLDCWVAQQLHDSGTNKIIHAGWRYVMGTVPKDFNFGKLEVGTKGDAETEYELISLRVLRNDQIMLEIDKENAICRWWNGFQLVDNARRIRQLIGL